MSPPLGLRVAGSPYRIGVLVLVAVTLVYRTWSVNRFGWEYDDWNLLNIASTEPFGHHWLQSLNGHLMPGAFLMTSVLTAISPLGREAAAVTTALAAALAVVVWAMAFRTMFGERLRLLLPLAVLALTPLAVRPVVWWTSALQMLPLEIGMGVCVWFTARYARRHDAASLAMVVLGLLIGLFFYEKSVLLVVPVACVLLFCSQDGLLRTLRRAWPLLVTLGVVLAAYLSFYLLLATTASDRRTFGVGARYWPGLRLALSYYGQAASNDVAPAVLGGPWGSTPVPGGRLVSPAWPVVTASCLLVLALVVVAVVLRRRAWLPLAMVLGYGFVATSLIVLSSRIQLYGVFAVREERYNIDTVTVATLAAAMLLCPLRSETSSEAFRRRPPWLSSLAGSRLGARRLWISAALVLVLSLLVSNVWLQSRLGVQPGRTWLRHATADIDRAAPVELFDDAAPSELRPQFGIQGVFSRMLSPLGDKVSFDGPAETLLVFDKDGHLRNGVVGRSAFAAPGPLKGCGYAFAAGQVQRMPLNGPLFTYHWGAQLTAYAGVGGILEVDVGGQQIQIQIDKGFGRHQFGFSGPVDDVRLRLLPGSAPVCVTDLTFGPVRPGSRR